MRPGAVSVLALACALAACRGEPHGHHEAHELASVNASAPNALQAVKAVHGGAGPWVVAGYRAGEFALKKLGLARGSFNLEVTHHTPREVQFSCIADGAAAATGASAGKLNLVLRDATAAEVRTVYTKKSTGESVTLKLTGAFAKRFLDVPREKLEAAGREVLALRDDEIFEIAP